MHVLWHVHGIYRYIGQNLGYEKQKQTNYMEIITQMYNMSQYVKRCVILPCSWKLLSILDQ
jgi:hypothetical protein